MCLTAVPEAQRSSRENASGNSASLETESNINVPRPQKPTGESTWIILTAELSSLMSF